MPNRQSGNPPSYEPRSNAKRPSARGAKIVGKSSKSASFSVPKNPEGNSKSNLPPEAKSPNAVERLARKDAVNTPPPSFQPRNQNRKARSSHGIAAQPPAPTHNSKDSFASQVGSASQMPPKYYPAGKSARQTRPASETDSSHNRATRYADYPTNNSSKTHNDGNAPLTRPPFLSTPSHTSAGSGLAGETQSAPRRRRLRLKKVFLSVCITLLVVIGAVTAWGIHLYNFGSSQMNKIEALSGAANTPGTTYLIAGSDKREGEAAKEISGQRSDTIMLLHLPESGTPALISIPRDSYVNIPDYGGNKINAAYAFGGAPLLVKTVEELSGLTIDHYVEIGMDGVVKLTDAVGGINLCYDSDVYDAYSTLDWKAGCHDVDGNTALAFARMRYGDPEGDIGRAKRQRQVVSKILAKATAASTFYNPFQQKRLVGAGASILTVDNSDSLWDVAKAALGMKKATGAGGVTGTPPLGSLEYYGPNLGGGVAVQLDPERIDSFWHDLREGTLTPEKYETIRQGGQAM